MQKRDEQIVDEGRLFQRLQAHLAGIIEATPPGERLMAEPELAKKLGVSRATLREAMRSFEGQGLIRRRQGVGTFVVERKKVIETGLEVLESLETMSRKIGLNVTMGDVRISKVTANEKEAEALKVEVGTNLVEVKRVIRAENRPVAFLIDVLPEHVLPAAELENGFTGSVLDFLLKRGSPALSESSTELQAVAALPEIARYLQIQRGDVLFMIEAQLFDVDDNIVDHSFSYFLPGYFRFHITRRVGNLSNPIEE